MKRPSEITVLGCDIAAAGPTFTPPIRLAISTPDLTGNYLDANPELQDMVRHHAERGQMVPVAKDGEFVCFANRTVIDRHPVPAHLGAQDFVVGLEALGHRLSIYRAQEDGPEIVMLSRAIDAEPESWQTRTNDLLAAYGRGRNAETIAFLRRREAERG